MISYIFIWRDDNGNNAYFQVETGSYHEAHKAFHDETRREYFALIQGANLEMREFIA